MLQAALAGPWWTATADDEPQPSDPVDGGARELSADRCRPPPPFVRIGLPETKIPPAQHRLRPGGSARTERPEFRVVLKDYRFLGANYKGKVCLTNATDPRQRPTTKKSSSDCERFAGGPMRCSTRGFAVPWPRSRSDGAGSARHSWAKTAKLATTSHNPIMRTSVTQPTIDELLDRAVQAINRGDRATADALAGQVLAVDRSNPDAEELLAAPGDSGEIRRLTILFADLVDSTALSTRIEPEIYRTVVGRYRDQVPEVVDRYEGHIGSTQGDGLLAVFGHPESPRERRAPRGAGRTGHHRVRSAGSASGCSDRFGFDISVRVGIHRGLVYLDTAQDDVYGFGANLAARICGLAEPGTVAMSETIERLVRDSFELEEPSRRNRSRA